MGHRDLKIKLVFNKLRVPVGDVDCVKERHPFLIAGHTKGFLHKRGPLRLHWPADERHASAEIIDDGQSRHFCDERSGRFRHFPFCLLGLMLFRDAAIDKKEGNAEGDGQ